MKQVTFIVCALILAAGLDLTAQDKPSHDQKYFVNNDGKLYWHKGKPVYLFISEDPEGKQIQRLESQGLKEFTNPMFFDTEGVNFIRSRWAVDKDGNYATPKQEVMFEVYNDGTAPTTTVSFEVAKSYKTAEKLFYGPDLQVNVSSNDALSGVQTVYYSENGSDFKEYTGVITPSTDQDYSYQFYAVDNVGNVEVVKSFQFTVDVTNPTTTFSVVGDKIEETLSPRSTIALSSSDNSSDTRRISYQIDEGPVRTYTRDIRLSTVKEGDHKLTFYSTDNVGNVEEGKTYDFFLDRSAPEVVASVVGDQYEVNGKTYVSGRSQLKLEASDNKAGVKDIGYRVRNGEEQLYAGPISLPQDQGKLNITFFGTDKVNNDFRTLFDESAAGLSSLNVDLTAPRISSAYEGQQFVSRDTTFITGQTLIGLFAQDSESGVKSIGYKVNGGEEKVYDGQFIVEAEGFYTIEYWSDDQVNNRSTDSFSFMVDNTGPQIESILSMEAIGTISLDDMDNPIPVYSSGTKLYMAATDEMVDTKSIFNILNDGTEQMYTKPVFLLKKGINSFRVRAVDQLGNETVGEITQVFIK